MRVDLALAGMLTVCLCAYSPLLAQGPGAPTEPPASAPEPQRQGPARQVQDRRGAGQARIPPEVEVVRDVVYATVLGADGQSIELKMDTAFLKQSDGKPLPVIVYIHGGGWQTGSKEAGLQQSALLALGGYFAATIDYRLSNVASYPAAVHDCKAAIRFIRSNAEELGVDPDRIGVWGHSAGAHLAALLGTTSNTNVLNGDVGDHDDTSCAVQCVVEFSGPTDLTRAVTEDRENMVSRWLGGAVAERLDRAKQASPTTYVDANDPPVLIIHGTADEVVNVDHAALFEKALSEAGAKVEYIAVDGAGHAIVNPRMYLRAAAFFDQYLQGHASDAMRERFQQRRGKRDEGEPAERNAGDGGPRRRRPLQDEPAAPATDQPPTTTPSPN